MEDISLETALETGLETGSQLASAIKLPAHPAAGSPSAAQRDFPRVLVGHRPAPPSAGKHQSSSTRGKIWKGWGPGRDYQQHGSCIEDRYSASESVWDSPALLHVDTPPCQHVAGASVAVHVPRKHQVHLRGAEKVQAQTSSRIYVFCRACLCWFFAGQARML